MEWGFMARIILAADHAGFALKQGVKKFLESRGHEVLDMSPSRVEGDDYPDVALSAARKVVSGKCLGVFICGSGNGVCMAANKVRGIRAALGYDAQSAALARRHNDANVLCLAGRRIKPEAARKVVSAWLSSEFEAGRHERRVRKIGSYERFRF